MADEARAVAWRPRLPTYVMHDKKESIMGLGLIASLIVGGLAGWIASSLMDAKTGLLANIGLGILGAVLLNGALGLIGIYAERAFLPQLVVGAAGAAALIWIVRKLT